eukprot:scaffold4.g4910.t1
MFVAYAFAVAQAQYRDALDGRSAATEPHTHSGGAGGAGGTPPSATRHATAGTHPRPESCDAVPLPSRRTDAVPPAAERSNASLAPQSRPGGRPPLDAAADRAWAQEQAHIRATPPASLAAPWLQSAAESEQAGLAGATATATVTLVGSKAPKGWDACSGRSSSEESEEPEATPPRRTSQTVPGAPPPAGAEGARRGGGSSSDDDGGGSSDEEDMALEDMRLEAGQPFYRRASFWLPAASWAVSLCFFTAGLVLLIVEPNAQTLLLFDAWRWCFFLCTWPVIYWASRAAMWLITCIAEWRFVTARTLLFFLVGTRGALMNVMRSSLALAAFAGLFKTQRGAEGSRVALVFDTILKARGEEGLILACLVLFTVANMLKKVIAKLLATQFHKRAHFKRMQEALRKEFYLNALCAPREHLPYRDSTASGAPPPVRPPLGRGLLARSTRTLLRSFSRRRRRGSDPLLMEGSPRSDLGLGLAEEAESDATLPEAERGGGGGGQGPASPLEVAVAVEPPSPAAAAAAAVALRGPSSARLSHLSVLSAAAPCGGLRPDSRQLSLASAATRASAPPPPGPRQPLHALLDLPCGAAGAGAGAGGAPATRRVQRRPGGRMNVETVQRLERLERHLRRNRLYQIAGARTSSGEGERGECGGGAGRAQVEARQLAVFLMHNCRRSRRRQHLLLMDLHAFLPPDQAAEAFRFLDRNGDGAVSLHELKLAVAQIYQERKHLALTLRDAKTVISRLEGLIGGAIHVLFVFFYLSIFSVDVTKARSIIAWLTFSSIVLAFTFVFGNSIRSVYENAVFLFGTHAFDVGDVLLVGGEQHSENKSESFQLTVDVETPAAVVELLTQAVSDHVRGQPKEFSGASAVGVRGLADPLKLLLSVWYEFSHPGVESGRISTARHGLVLAIAKVLQEAGVQFSLPPLHEGRRCEAGGGRGGSLGEARLQHALAGDRELAAVAGVPHALARRL